MLALLATTPILVWAAWSRGQRDGELITPVWTFRVNGNSMAPTLLGPHHVASCDTCQLTWPVDLSSWKNRSGQPICSHCGGPLSATDPETSGSSSQFPADLVEIERIDAELTELRRGDLVAAEWSGELHLKRIVALPGEVVALDGLRLQVDGRRLEDLLYEQSSPFGLPWFAVDVDAARDVSRWFPPSDDSGWICSASRNWEYDGEGKSDWLVYHHRSVHDHQRPSRVWDDYPMNIGLQRKLHGVDRLRLRADIQCPQTVTIEVAFWSEAGSRIIRTSCVGQQQISLEFAAGEPADSLPVDAQQPVAIRCVAGSARLADLSIDRLVEYRLRPHDAQDRYPLSLGPQDYFLLGDNVPVSIDSRDVGAISSEQIIGRVKKRQ